MRRRAGWLLLMGLSVACAQSEQPVQVLANRCLADADCVSPELCDLTRQQCYREAPDHPYKVWLKVYASPENAERVVQLKLDKSKSGLQIVVPPAKSIVSAVTKDDAPVEAQVTFTPIPDDGLPAQSTVVSARAQDETFSVGLNPGTVYRVSAQPLVVASSMLPPILVSEYDPEQPLELSYGPTSRLDAKLVDESGTTMNGYRVRLEDATTGAIISSSSKVADNGDFTLYMDSALLAQNPSYNLAISLREDTPWRIKVAIGVTLSEGGRPQVTMPRLPAYVRFYGYVEDGRRTRVPYAQVMLESTFPFEEGDVRDRDWCRLKKQAAVKVACSAKMTTTADANGEYELLALPGSYTIAASPGANAADRALATSQLDGPSLIESQPDGQQGSYAIVLADATRFSGSIRALRKKGAVPNVSVTASALDFVGDLPAVARLNRTVTAKTDDRGYFQFSADVGYYDLVVEPPADSGFAWSGALNRIVVDGADSDSVDAFLNAPVFVEGKVLREGTSMRPLNAARIEAYAFVSSLSDGQRAILIGSATSNKQGEFRIPLPPTIGEELCEQRAMCDCGDLPDVTRECNTETGTFETCQCQAQTSTSPDN